jgi:hypothetical protein
MSEFPCPHCRGASAHDPVCITRLADQLSRFITPEMEAKQVASRARIRERNARLFGRPAPSMTEPEQTGESR